jgi:hypothetical protein
MKYLVVVVMVDCGGVCGGVCGGGGGDGGWWLW